MSQRFIFEKMHGIGNDFVLIDCRKQHIEITTPFIQKIANRHKGIGFDQLLLIEKAHNKDVDASYRFFNPDGSQAEQCGNGQRCISLYLNRLNPEKKDFSLSGLSGVIRSTLLKNTKIKVNMGGVKNIKTLKIEGSDCFSVDFGNPHLVLVKPNIADQDLNSLNKKHTKQFDMGVNFELVQLIDRKTIKVRVHERGTGETLACGSGACAAFYALYTNKQVDSEVKVILAGGELLVQYNPKEKVIYLTGPAEHIFTGEIKYGK